jgi:dienelactone hydrolase
MTRLFVVFILMAGCRKEDPLSQAARGQLLASSSGGNLSKHEIIGRITEFPAQDVVSYDVAYYSITYSTEYLGKPIDSRGLLIVPAGMDSVRLLMYCHGTEIPLVMLGVDKITPSLYDGSKETHRDVRNMGLGWAGAGYMVFIPDYIGFGLTLGKDHPYLYYPEMFKSNIDGLLAVKQFIQRQGLHYDSRLFLAGWSQGAGAALSAHRYIQEEYASDFTVVASSGLSGPYHFSRFAGDVLSRKSEEMPVMPIFSWGVYAMNKFSGIRRPTDQIYTYPVFDQMSSILVPSTRPESIFNAYFLAKMTDGTDTAFLNELEKNSFHAGWRPLGKVFLHHGDADNLVPYFNSADARAGLTAAGGDVTLYTYPGGKHDTELGKFILNTLHDFNLLK